MKTEICRLGALALTSVLIALFIMACSPEEEQTRQERPTEVNPGKVVPDDTQLLAEGKKAWRSCGMCHCATDTRIKEDEDWVLLNEETTCIEAGKPAPRVRKALIAYLRHPETLRPVLVDQNYKPDEGKATGEVLVPAVGGSAHLKAGRDSVKKGSPSMIRLYWQETADEKSMAAPSGEYIVINYWLYRKGGKNGEERWMATGTNVDGCTEMYIEPEAEAYFELGSVIEGEFTSARKGDAFILSFSVHDVWGNRMTLSKNGRIIMPGYRILDGEGKILAEGLFGVI